MSKYLIDERPLTVQPTLIKALGFEKAVIVQQFHWLLNQPRTGMDHAGHRWIWGTYTQWCNDFFTYCEPRTLRYHITACEKMGVIVSEQIKSTDWDHTKYYRIDYDVLNQLIAENCASMRQPVDASDGQRVDASNRPPVDASLYRTKKSTEKTTKPGVGGVSVTTADAYNAYQNEIGSLTAISADQIGALCDEFTAAWFIEAIGVAVKANTRRLSYIEGILKRWHRDGKDTGAKQDKRLKTEATQMAAFWGQ
jgi:DnaD/phage-associated family protein